MSILTVWVLVWVGTQSGANAGGVSPMMFQSQADCARVAAVLSSGWNNARCVAAKVVVHS